MADNPEALPPQFDIEGESQGWRDKTKDWFKKNSSIILAIVIIIVLAGGIYAYTSRSNIQPITFDQESINTEIPKEPNPEDELDLTEITQTPEGIGGPSNLVNLPEEEIFTETAQKGDGITHLARRALAKYLEKTGGDAELNKEHKIFIEDYLQNRTGTEALEINESRSFSKNLIEQAIQASKNLTPEQLQKIAPYASLVSSL